MTAADRLAQWRATTDAATEGPWIVLAAYDVWARDRSQT